MQSMQQSWNSSYLFGANSDFIEELYELYLEDQSSIDPKWKQYFDSLQDGGKADVNHSDVKHKFAILTSHAIVAAASDEVLHSSQTKVYGLIASFRQWGHKFAKLDPLERVLVERPSELDYRFYGLDAELETEFYDDYDLRRAKQS
jgi:2-oxoglutarate dehydrogenase E1 component